MRKLHQHSLLTFLVCSMLVTYVNRDGKILEILEDDHVEIPFNKSECHSFIQNSKCGRN